MEKISSIRCPLCGGKFFQDKVKCSLKCPLSKGCELCCCPNCGYTFKEKSEIIEFFRSLFGRKNSS